MGVYSPESLGIQTPAEGFKQGEWIQGRHFWGGTLSEVNQLHPSSGQSGAGEQVSKEVRGQSAAAQGVTPQSFDEYLAEQAKKGAGVAPQASPSQPQQTGVNPGSTDGVMDAGFEQPGVPNLPELYENLYESQGIKAKEASLIDQEKKYLEVRNKITDNPYMTAGVMDQRLRRLQQLYEKETKPIRDEIATSKADVETQLNLQLQQFNINSQAATQALNQFNVLLTSGALTNASGEAIASLTRSTGIPSSMIYSAITEQNKKNIQTSTITFDDGTNQGFAIINSQTGEIISKQTVAPSKPLAPKTLSAFETESIYKQAATEDIVAGRGVKEIFGTYTGLIDPDLLLSLYNAQSPHGGAHEINTEPELLRGFGVNVEQFQGKTSNKIDING